MTTLIKTSNNKYTICLPDECFPLILVKEVKTPDGIKQMEYSLELSETGRVEIRKKVKQF